MKIRTLKSEDLFTMLRIIDKIGVNDLTDSFFKKNIMQFLFEKTKEEEENNEESKSAIVSYQITLNIVSVIVGNLNKAKSDIFEFIADLTDEKVETIEQLPLAQFIKLVREIIQSEDFKDFFVELSEFF